MQVFENKAEVKVAEVPHTPIATSAGAEPPLQEDASKDEAAPENKLRRIDYGWRGEMCLDCVWFVEDETPGGDAGRLKPEPIGECHRHPPVFREGQGVMGKWPRVRKWSDVCGDGEVMDDVADED
jgi:hypothetical protein